MSEGAFEAKVSAKRETSSGIFVTLEIQPNDYTADLATLRVGSALQVGWAEIVDTSVQPLTPAAPSSNGKTSDFESENLRSTRSGAAKLKTPFKEKSLPEQAGIRTADINFRRFLATFSPCDGIAIFDSEMAADTVRHLCGVKSRAELSINHEAANKWRQLENDYQAWITDQMHASSIR